MNLARNVDPVDTAPANGFHFVERPSLAEVSALICRTWRRPCWSYDEGLLALHIMRPSGDPSFAIGQRDLATRQLASFQAFMPFDVEYLGRRYRSVFASFLTVSTDFQGKGLAGPQQARLIEKAMHEDYDLYLTMCEVGAASNRSVEKTFASFGIDVTNIGVIRYLGASRALVERALPAARSGNTRPYVRDDRAKVTPLVRDAGRGLMLRKIVPTIDVDFLLLERPHARTFVFESNGAVRAFANVLVLEVLEENATKTNLYFDHAYFGDLTRDEQDAFIADVLAALRTTEYDAAFLPNIGYVPTEAFAKLHFRTLPRALNVLAAPLKRDVVPGGIVPVDAFHLDVY